MSESNGIAKIRFDETAGQWFIIVRGQIAFNSQYKLTACKWAYDRGYTLLEG